MSPLRLALLDRDGTLNRKPPEGEYVTTPAALELLPGAAAAVRLLNDAGVPVAVVTNQRCIALGRLSSRGLAAIHAALAEGLADRAGAWVDAVYHCPHEGASCDCRKPEPGLLRRAARDFGVTPSETVMIGDAASDVEAGRRFGARTVQLTAGPSDADATARHLLGAVAAEVARGRRSVAASRPSRAAV
jgi:D-glycero-D-manno-heptose 1,7-bisphosphate phosphatase